MRNCFGIKQYMDFCDNNYELNHLRSQISYVHQNSKLFNKTILENIKYGNNMSEDEIIKVCNNINVMDIFKNLSEYFLRVFTLLYIIE